MNKSPLAVYKEFREGMLSGTNSWIGLITEQVKLKGPLAEIEGKEDFIKINEPFFASIKENTVHKAIEHENYVITQVTTEVEVPSGKRLKLEVSEWYEITDNKISSLRVYFDTAEFLREMS